MCILCQQETLEQLTTPLERLGAGKLADAIRTARDAAAPGVMDYAEAVLRGEAAAPVEPQLYDEVVVGRAVEAGLLTQREATEWAARLRAGAALGDPRVQAFLSTAAEIVDEYRLLLGERRQVLERYLEARGAALEFGWIGQDGELWFEYRDAVYAVLSEEEAYQVVERELVGTLHTLDPATLLLYSKLPETAREVLAGIQAKPADVADDILAGMIDLQALADDRVRVEGFGPYFRDDEGHTADDQRFGEWVVVRRAPEEE